MDGLVENRIQILYLYLLGNMILEIFRGNGACTYCVLMAHIPVNIYLCQNKSYPSIVITEKNYSCTWSREEARARDHLVQLIAAIQVLGFVGRWVGTTPSLICRQPVYVDDGPTSHHPSHFEYIPLVSTCMYIPPNNPPGAHRGKFPGCSPPFGSGVTESPGANRMEVNDSHSTSNTQEPTPSNREIVLNNKPPRTKLQRTCGHSFFVSEMRVI